MAVLYYQTMLTRERFDCFSNCWYPHYLCIEVGRSDCCLLLANIFSGHNSVGLYQPLLLQCDG